MNKMMKSIFSAILTLVMLLSFTGCGDSEDIQSSDPVNIAFQSLEALLRFLRKHFHSSVG